MTDKSIDIVDLENRFKRVISTSTNTSNIGNSAGNIGEATAIERNSPLNPGSSEQLSSVKEYHSNNIIRNNRYSLLDIRKIWNCLKSHYVVSTTTDKGLSLSHGLYPDLSVRSFSTSNSVLNFVSRLLFHSQNELLYSESSFDTKGLSSVSIPSNQQTIDTNSRFFPLSTEAVSSSLPSNVDRTTFLMSLYQSPLTFSTGKSECSFEMNGTSLKLYKSDYSSYSFSSDDECDKRNRRIDAVLLEEEKEEHNSTDYKLMLMQNKELDGLFPDDHISVYYTVLHFRAIHKTEGELVSNLSLQWSQEECFRPILEKYDSVHLILEFKENDWIQDVRAAISNHTATSALIEQYHDFQSVLITRKLQLRSEFYNVSHYSDSPIHCDGCDIPRNQKKVKAILNYQNGLLIRKFVGNEEVQYTDTPWFPSNDQKFDVTAIVTAFGYNRLFALRQFMYRYQGPIVLVIYATSTQEIHLVRYISTHFIPKRVTILFYLVSRYLKSSTVFPINRLRNLAIRNIRTTHFLILDMDLRLSLNTYKEVMSLPQFLYQSNRSAVILPVFFYIGKQILAHCSSTESCSYLSNWIQPENKLELIECINRKICISNKNNIRTHMYVMPEWFTTSKESHVSRVRCFITNFMEPYLMVKYSPTLPLFEERFVNYGYNKVQYFEHLRQAGFQYYILNHAFAMDFPHPDSGFRRKYLGKMHAINDMKEVYNDLQMRLNEQYRSVTNFPVCFKRQEAYYEELI